VSKRERDKGLLGEREVRHLFEGAGFAVRGLEGMGDNLVLCDRGLTLHLETKRQERVSLPLWARQAEAEAPAGTVPVVCWRPSRALWRADLSLEHLLGILRR